jgi:RNA polymerase sigma factor for flagellar operon FliA
MAAAALSVCRAQARTARNRITGQQVRPQGKPGSTPGPRGKTRAERDRLLLELLPQVRYIARRIHDRLPAHVPMDDLYQAGVIGLMDALKKFDPNKKVQLQSYMKFRIRGAIVDGLRELDWSPRDLRKRGRELENAEQRLRARLGRNPAGAEIAAEVGISLGQFHRLLGDLRGLDICSLQEAASTSEEGVEQEYSMRVAAPREQDPFHRCIQSEKKEKLANAIEGLPEKERQVVALYYYEELTMKEIGRALSVGESRVSQIHSMAMLRLRARLEEERRRAGSAAAARSPATAALSAQRGCPAC